MPIRRICRRYRNGTLILETDFETAEGAVTLVGFMPPREKHSDVVRLVHGRRGTLRAIAGPNMMVLRTSAEMRGEGLKTVSEFTVKSGEAVPFVLTYGASHLGLPRAIEPKVALRDTERFWNDWIRQCKYRGPCREVVDRSLITLKALAYWLTGGILAAPTTSLPERIGGARNWDYRFCWLRAASYTLLALMQAGFHEEAAKWRSWLLRSFAGSPDQVQIMYGLAGERRVTEWNIDWLPGYEKSRPVRVGNGAAEQSQLDVYGEVMSTLHHAHKDGLRRTRPEGDLDEALLGHLAKIWREPDNGILGNE